MSPARRYRLLLLAYPRSYRAERAEEMVDVLLATEERRGTRSVLLEAASLVGHGVALRLRRPAEGRPVAPSLGLAGASLAILLAVLGAQQLLAAAQRGLGLDGYPDAWRLDVVWVDPRWPVQLFWVTTGLALLLRRNRLAVVSAWTAAVLHVWLFVVTAVTTVDLPWPGDVGPHWVATGGTPQAGWVLLGLAGAVLLGGPVRLSRARAALTPRRCRTAGAVGLLGAGVAACAGPAVYAVLGNAALGLSDSVRGPGLPLVLSATVLVRGLLRVPHGRGALVLLGVLAAAPLAARWSEPMTAVGAGAATFAAGYVVASWARRADPSAPPSRV